MLGKGRMEREKRSTCLLGGKERGNDEDDRRGRRGGEGEGEGEGG